MEGIFRVSYAVPVCGDEVSLKPIEHPADRKTVAAVLQKAGLDKAQCRAVYIDNLDTAVPGLNEAIPDAVTIDEMNYLAVKISSLNGAERDYLIASLEAKRHCKNPAQLINLVENIHRGCFDIIPVQDAADYGNYILSSKRSIHSVTLSHVQESPNYLPHGLAEYIGWLEKSVGFEQLGNETAIAEGGSFTSLGYIVGTTVPFITVYHDPRDIPAEHRVLASQECLMTENADLTSFLLKMHAMCGEYMSDIPRNLNMLAARHYDDYLILMTGKSISITGAVTAYQHGHTTLDDFMNTGEDSRAFAFRVTGVCEGRLTGNLAEVNLTELQEDIRRHSIRYTRVEVTPKIGPDRSYTREQWDALEPIDRDELQSWTFTYRPEKQKALDQHLEDLYISRAEAGTIIAPDAFLVKLGAAYMRQAKTPRPEMLRVNLQTAKDILLHGDIEVFRLMPYGPEELSNLDAMPTRGGLWYKEYREFAIDKDDLPGLEKWAQREAAKVMHPRQDRGEANKSRRPER
jgi:hypothetical protein